MKRIDLWLDEIEPSANVYTGKGRGWQKYNDLKGRYMWIVKIACIKHKPVIPFRKAFIKVHYFFPDMRRRDPSNYAGKFLFDGLVLGGMIVDDDFKHIKPSFEANFGCKKSGTKVIIYDLSEVGDRSDSV